MRRRKNEYEVEDRLTVVEMIQGVGVLLLILLVMEIGRAHV